MFVRAMILALAAILVGCAQPTVQPRLISFQEKFRTSEHWHEMASATADKIVEYLQKIKDASATGHVLDGVAQSTTLAARPIYVRPLDSEMPFSEAFHNFLVLQLMVRGQSVATMPAGATVINYDVQLLPYDHKLPYGYPYVPGETTAVAGLAYGVGKAAQASATAGWFAAAGAIDIIKTTERIFGELPNTEVIITTEVVDDRAYVFRNVDIFYIEDEDARLYAASFNARPARPLPTGPSVPYPMPARTMRVAEH